MMTTLRISVFPARSYQQQFLSMFVTLLMLVDEIINEMNMEVFKFLIFELTSMSRLD